MGTRDFTFPSPFLSDDSLFLLAACAGSWGSGLFCCAEDVALPRILSRPPRGLLRDRPGLAEFCQPVHLYHSSWCFRCYTATPAGLNSRPEAGDDRHLASPLQNGRAVYPATYHTFNGCHWPWHLLKAESLRRSSASRRSIGTSSIAPNSSITDELFADPAIIILNLV